MDPNGIAGKPTEREVWLAPNWSDYKAKTAPQPPGWTYAVVRETTYNDGRVIAHVLDKNGKPLAADGTTASDLSQARVIPQLPDTDQEKRFKEAQTTAQRQTDQSERQKDSEYPGTYPDGHPLAGQPAMVTKYVDGHFSYAPMPREVSVSAKPTIPHFEGTPTGRRNPDGTPEYDNSKPIMVERDPDTNQQVGAAKPLTSDQRTQWEREQGIASSTSGNGTKIGSRTEVKNGQEVTTETWRLPDNRTEERVSTQPAPAASGNGTKIASTTEIKDGKEVTTETWRLPDGKTEQRVAAAPAPAASGNGVEISRRTEIKDGKEVTTGTFRLPDGKTEQRVIEKPAEPTKATPTQIITDPTTHEQSEIIRNPDGTVKEVRPLRGTPTGPTTRAPSLPNIVVGASQDALRQGYDDIQAEVDAGRRTPAWGENRRKEILSAAQLTVQESQLHEQSRQFNQTQAFNVANARMQNGSDALTNAMKFALSINGKLKPGSQAGAQLFRNFFMLQMKMMHDSGIDAIRPGGGRSSVGDPSTRPGGGSSQADRRPPPRVDPGNHEALSAAADKSAESISQGLATTQEQAQQTTNPDGTPRVSASPPVVMPGAAPVAPTQGQAQSSTNPDGTPRVSSSPPAPAASAAPLPAAVAALNLPPSPAPVVLPRVAAPATAAPAPRAPSPPVGAPIPAPSMVPGAPSVVGDTGAPPVGMPPPPPAPPSWATPPNPRIVQPGDVPAQSGDPIPDTHRRIYSTSGQVFDMVPDGQGGYKAEDVTTYPGGYVQKMAPPSQFSAVQALAPQVQPPAPDPTGGIDIPPALLHAQVAATPPWRLLDRMDELKRMGVPDETIFSYPGQDLVGVG